jgi:putative aldouronate transport system substrate-binding protein
MDANKATRDFNNNATPSVALGFTFNSEPVKTQYAQLTALQKEYQQIFAGLMDAGKLEEYIRKQKNAGLQDVIDECQKQLDAWVASNE